MADWRVPLADVQIAESDLEAAVETYRSGWLTMGPRTEEFERAFADYTGARHAVAVSSGTAALHLISLAAGLGPGDEVVVPSLTFVATVSAPALTGASPVFADIEGLRAPWLSVGSVEAVLSERTKAVMTMSYGGHPGDTVALAELADRHGLVLLEDAAHAAGSRLAGRHLGTFGAAGAFSFFSNKNLAVGEGGMLVTDDEELAERARSLRAWGVTKLRWERGRGRPTDYDIESLGLNYRIDEPRSALGLRRLARLDAENARRAELADAYRAALAGIEEIEPSLPEPDDAVLSHHLFTVVLHEQVDRDAVRSALAERGVETSVHYPPVHRFSYFADAGAELPTTDAYSARTLTLPLFAGMTGEQHDLVLEALEQSLPTAREAAAGG